LYGDLLKKDKMDMKKILVWGAVIVYLLWPVDLVPEAVIPIFGYIDDAIVAYLGYNFLRKSDKKKD
jgi:uncharacterized membrane protein YkvA (DUF1232 family)